MKELAVIYIVMLLALFVVCQGFKSCVKECVKECIQENISQSSIGGQK